MEGLPGMDAIEIEKFLSSGKMILRLATVDQNKDPIIYPVWFWYDDGRLYLFTERRSRKVRNISRSPRVYFSVDTEKEPYNGVKGKAMAMIIEESSKVESIASNIITKYLGGIDSPYAESMMKSVKSGESIVVELTPAYYSTWDSEKAMTTGS